MDLCIGRQTRIDARCAEKVECDQSLREEAVPKMKREIGVGAAKACNKVVLKSTDGTFGSIAAVNLGGVPVGGQCARMLKIV
jgi:hypothetical protein